MHTLDLLEQAISTAKSLGFNIRQEWLDGHDGGYCEIAGKKWIFIDLSLNSMEKLDQVLDAIQQDPALESVPLTPELSQLLSPKRRAA